MYSRWIIVLLLPVVFTADNQSLNHSSTTMAKHKKWVITLSNQRPISDVSKDLTKVGLTVNQVLTEIGCVTGTASDNVAKKLRSVPGVADVSPEHNIDIGPPDAEITW